MDIKGIITGHVNEILGKEKELSNDRMAICRVCPLFKQAAFGPQCNPSLYLNKETNEVSEEKKDNFVKGCGCRLNAKTRLPDASCPVGKW